MIPGELLLDPGTRPQSRPQHACAGGEECQRPTHPGRLPLSLCRDQRGPGFRPRGCARMRLNIASGMAVRFEPGQQRTVELVDIGGDRKIYGFRGLIQGAL